MTFAVVITLLLLFGGGVVVALAVLPDVPIHRLLPAAPLLAMAVAYATGVVLLRTPLRFGPAWVGAIFASFGLVAILRRRRSSRGTEPVQVEQSPPGGTQDWTDLLPVALVILATVVASVVLYKSFVGRTAVPPAIDSVAHGFMTKRIIVSGTIDTQRLWLVFDHPAPGGSRFYPVAMHVMAAMVSQLSGSTVAEALFSVIAVSVAVCLPLGCFSLVRAITGDPLAGGIAALASVSIGFFPYKPLEWGGLTLLVGMCLLPGVVELSVDAIVHARRRRIAFLSLCGVGLFGVHSSEVVAYLIFVGALCIVSVRSWPSLLQLGKGLLWWALAGAFAVLLMAPLIPDFVGVANAKGGYGGIPTTAYPRALAALVLLRGNAFNGSYAWSDAVIAIAASVLLVAAFVRYRSRLAGLLLGGAVFSGLYLVAATNDGPLADLLTGAWYRHPDRVAYNFVLVIVAVGAAGATAVVRFLGSEGARRWLQLGMVGFVAVLLVAAALGPVRREATSLVPLTTTVTSSEVAAFRYLGDHVDDQGRVLNDQFREGSAWMYTYDSVMPVFQLQPEDWNLWNERAWLAQNIQHVGQDPSVDALVRRYRVRYVYFGDRTFFDGDHRLMDLAELRAAPGLRSVFERGSAHVFEVNLDGTRP